MGTVLKHYITGYDPAKKKKTPEMVACPHCWFHGKTKGAVTQHINREHWQLLEEAGSI